MPAAPIGLYGNPLGGATSLYRRGVRYKANPRDAAYMRRLFAEQWPDGCFVDADADPHWPEAVPGAPVVLLYPDAIGLGFSPLERRMRSLRPASVTVLNGRHRRFAWDPAVRRALRLRRFLSWTMAGELAAGALIVATTPVLLIWDAVRGRV